MIFIIEGKEYDIEAGLAKVTLHTLFELKVKHGISAKDLQEMAQYLQKFDGQDATVLMNDKTALRALMIVIWLARKHAGEKVSLEEANSFSMDAFFIKPEEEPLAGADEDPKATPPVSEAAAAEPPA
jgi:hypothetical protein